MDHGGYQNEYAPRSMPNSVTNSVSKIARSTPNSGAKEIFGTKENGVKSVVLSGHYEQFEAEKESMTT